MLFPNKKSQKKHVFLVSADQKSYFFSLAVFLLLVVTTGTLAFFSFFREHENEEAPPSVIQEKLSVEQQTTQEPLSTPKEASYTLKIMNASGITGLAGKMKKTLETEAKKEGWSSLTITTGNTSNQTGTTLTFKKENFETTQLGQLIQQSFPDATLKTDLQQIEDILIILGK